MTGTGAEPERDPDQRAHRPQRSWLGLGLRALVSIVPLLWVARRVDVAVVLSAFHRLELRAILLVSLAPLASVAVAPVRWRVLLRSYGATVTPPYRTLLRHTLVGMYFNALPGAIAGDALRAYRTRHVLSGITDGATVLVAERISGLIGLLLLGTSSLLWGGVGLSGGVARSLLLGAILAGVLAALVFASPAIYRRALSARVRPGFSGRLDALIRRIPPPKAPSGLAIAVLLSLLTQGFPMLQILYLVAVLSPGVSLASVVLVLPGIILLTYIPVTPAAVGQRELVYVQMLGLVGVDTASAVSASLLVLVSSLATIALGGIVRLGELGG